MHSVIPRWPPMLGRSPLWCIVCVLLVQSPACFPFYSLRIARSTKGTNVAICDVHDSLVRSLLPLCSRSPSMMPKMPPRGAMRHHRSSAAKPRAYVHGTKLISRRTVVYRTPSHVSFFRKRRDSRSRTRHFGGIARNPAWRVTNTRGRCDATREMLYFERRRGTTPLVSIS